MKQKARKSVGNWLDFVCIQKIIVYGIDIVKLCYLGGFFRVQTHNAEISFFLCRQGPPTWHLCRHNTLESYHRVPGCAIMRFQWKMRSYLVFLLRRGFITWQCDLWYPWLWLTRMWRHQPRSFLIVRRAGLLWSQQDFEWLWSVPLSSASLY